MSASKVSPKMQASSVSLTIARQNLFDLVDTVAKTGQAVTLTEHGEPKAVVVPLSQFEHWAETDSPRRIAPTDGKKKMPYAMVSRYERLAKSLEGAGFLLREKPTTVYGSKPTSPGRPKNQPDKN